MNTIYLWSDIRETSLHQKYIVLDYQEKLIQLGFKVHINQTRNWQQVYEEVKSIKPVLFILHGDKIFDIETLRKIHKICKIYVRWRWHPDPPKDLMDNCFIASKVSQIKNNYQGKLFYSPHPAITKYFYPFEVNDPKYISSNRIIFVGLAGKRGNGFYERSKRVGILNNMHVRYLNHELFGTGDIGFYDYVEKAKYYNGAAAILSVSSFPDEINFRVFNALACKCILMADNTPAMAQYFKPYTHYIPYDKNSMQSFDDTANFVINHLQDCLNTAHEGYFQVMKHHTSFHRLKEALQKCEVL